ncbi:complex I NDUFA9 subunit family protein [Saccharospirillum salsuginis]|uniref:3-beta-hydroxy-Delta(5)-steroid dehydrogenase n=1 Tax=Saccharospirillum salsuginis TaxID=418750 RepID=A0A918KMZ6_9GAMM|nr:complex I NDUFA9 subunit family protein [Saccharospirillum salsuginis]GGX69927.1 3-beta-hydroxy-Delta(5)-steroid dehydrogenase [Saccharospirillum salsuginis]
MKPQWITVFGGTGFLGRRIVRALLDAGYPVRIAARHPTPPPGIDDRAVSVEWVRADLHDAASVGKALDDARGVVNAVSLYVESGGRNTFEAVHVDGAERLAETARERGIERLVHISGIGVDTESDSTYVRARARGENRVWAVFPQATILRPSVLFGPEDALLTALSRITLMPVIPLFGAGNTRLQPVYVEDVARAVHQAMARDDARGQIFELGGGTLYRYRELVRMVLRHHGRRRLLVPVPFLVWRGLASLASLLPGAPLTRDQVILMEQDNRVGDDARGFESLGIEPRSVEDLLEACLAS